MQVNLPPFGNLGDPPKVAETYIIETRITYEKPDRSRTTASWAKYMDQIESFDQAKKFAEEIVESVASNPYDEPLSDGDDSPRWKIVEMEYRIIKAVAVVVTMAYVDRDFTAGGK